jgi:hypothetical protein
MFRQRIDLGDQDADNKGQMFKPHNGEQIFDTCYSQFIRDPHHRASKWERPLRPRNELRIFKFNKELVQEERQWQSRPCLDINVTFHSRQVHKGVEAKTV